MTAPTSPSNSEGEILYPYQINWHEQWASCGWLDCGEYFEVDLGKVIKKCNHKIKMLPGAGFGDLTHPTTRLTLKMMAELVPDLHFIDIGCGSGILSFASLKLGALSATGIDIDRDAIKHAKANAKLNEIKDKATFVIPENFNYSNKNLRSVIAMNMIYSEQQVAWESLPQLHTKGHLCITSGILKEHKNHYLKLCKNWGWTLEAISQEKKWLCFCFTT